MVEAWAEPVILPLGPVISTESITPLGRDRKFFIRDDVTFSDSAQSLWMLRSRGELWNSLPWLNGKELWPILYCRGIWVWMFLGILSTWDKPFLSLLGFGHLLASVQMPETSLPLEVTVLGNFLTLENLGLWPSLPITAFLSGTSECIRTVRRKRKGAEFHSGFAVVWDYGWDYHWDQGFKRLIGWWAKGLF